MAEDLEEKQPEQQEMPRWREDFPIRWENDHYVTRRDLIKFLTLGSALLVGANVGIAVAGKTWSKPSYPALRIAGAELLAPSSSLLFRYPTEKDPAILLRTVNGEYHAYSQVCTHLSCSVIYQPENNCLFCPCHIGKFELTEGRPIAGPPVRPLPRILLEQRADELYATGVEV